MIDHVVLDIEIQKTIEETPGGWDATDKLGVSVAVTYDYRKDRFRIWGPEALEALRHRLLQADRITGFNIWRFDLPVIWAISRSDWPKQASEVFYPALRAKTDDLLERIWIALGLSADEFTDLHSGWGLDNVALGTLGRGKIGYGGDAPKWFQAGLWAKVANYCCDDVALERDLGAFVDRFGYVVNGKTGQVLHLAEWGGTLQSCAKGDPR